MLVYIIYGLDNLILTGRIEGKRDKEKERMIYLAVLSKWMTEQGLEEAAAKEQNIE